MLFILKEIVPLLLGRHVLLLLLRPAELADVVQPLPLVPSDPLMALVMLYMTPSPLLHDIRYVELMSEASFEEVKIFAKHPMQHFDGIRVRGLARTQVTNASQGLTRQSHAAGEELSHPRSRDLTSVGQTTHVLPHVGLHPHDLLG